MPEDYPFENFRDLYSQAWHAGLKGLATYRPNTVLVRRRVRSYLAFLRLLPATAQESAQFEVDERFVRQAARYRATFKAFLDRAPETGPLNRATFRDMIYGRVDTRLGLLPRPNRARVIDPHTLAAE